MKVTCLGNGFVVVGGVQNCEARAIARKGVNEIQGNVGNRCRDGLKGGNIVVLQLAIVIEDPIQVAADKIACKDSSHDSKRCLLDKAIKDFGRHREPACSEIHGNTRKLDYSNTLRTERKISVGETESDL